MTTKIFIAVVAGIFFARNFFIPISADDYVYKFVWNFETFRGDSDDWILISSFADIFKSQVEHYFFWGGRTIAHAVVQFFLWQGKIFFDVANTIVAVIFTWLIIRLSGKCYDWKIFVTVIGLWIFLPQFVPTMLWLTGSCNYLWMTTLQLGFLYALMNEKKICILLGFFAGWTNEAGSITIFLMSLMYFRIKKSPIEHYQILALILFSIGLTVMMFAPGNFSRAEFLEPFYELHTFSERFLYNLTNPFFETLLKSSPLILIAVLSRSKRSLFFTLAGFIAPAALLFSPEFPMRAAFISPVLFLIATLISLENFDWTKISRWIFCVIVVFFIGTLVAGLYADFRVFEKYEARKISEVVPRTQASHKLEKFLGERVITQQILDNDPTADKNFVYNRAMAKFYGVPEIRRKE